jgi:hypothetical protein
MVLPTCDESSLSALYTQYVEPFVSGAVPQSCSECHMTGIDISMYAQDTPCQTMACMVSMGAIDLNDPESSEILSQIQMGNPNSSVFDVNTEYQAMLEWAEWSAECHDQICGDVVSPCTAGTGAESTGTNPIGDCSEEDLLVEFWNSVVVDRHRCLTCHSSWGYEKFSFDDCTSTDVCEEEEKCISATGDNICLCLAGKCRRKGPALGPNFLEGGEAALDFNQEADKKFGLNTMYNIVALDLIDVNSPLDSKLLVKPLMEDFQPTQIYGQGVDISNVAPGIGLGGSHGGADKFSFGCHAPGAGPCPTSGVVDCRELSPCQSATDCDSGFDCLGKDPSTFCRLAGSYCDSTYTNYIRFIEYFSSCKSQP